MRAAIRQVLFAKRKSLFSAQSLFLNGEQGVWLDPSDFSTMFQDSAGTTPVTAVEQPVGLMLDRSGNDNNVSQSTSAARPVLSARYNLLVNTETLSTQNVTTVATDYVLVFSGAGSITLSGTKTGTYYAGSNALTGVTAGTLTLTVSGSVTQADLRTANDSVGLPVYQRVTTSVDYDTALFPCYLKFDGVDDFLMTALVSTLAQPVTVTAGIVIAATNGVLFNTTAAFITQFLSVFSNRIDMYAGSHVSSGASQALLTRYVHSYIFDGGASFNRVNGALNASSDVGSGAGSGNLIIGANDQYSGINVFCGRIYSFILRAALSTDAQIANTEMYANSKTNAY